MLNAARFLLVCFALLLAGVPEAFAHAPQNRVWKNFAPGPGPALENALQVAETHLENLSLYDWNASGSTVWTHFDPEGLYIKHRQPERKKSKNETPQQSAKLDREHADKYVKFWDNYKKSYDKMSKSKEGRKTLDYLENSKIEIEIGPSIVENGLSNTGSGKPGVTRVESSEKAGDYKVQVSLDTGMMSGNIFGTTNSRGEAITESTQWLTVPHELQHATEYEAGIKAGTPRHAVADPLNTGVVMPSDSKDRVNQQPESRAVRFSNIVAKESGQKAIQTQYGDPRSGGLYFHVESPLGTRTDLE